MHDSVTHEGNEPAAVRHESWLPIVGWERLYEVSDLGRVRSLPRKCSNGVRGGQVIGGCVYNNGYTYVWLTRGPRRERAALHHLVLKAFAGPSRPGQEALHGPGGKSDNRWPENLRWGTPAENQQDRFRDGTDSAGERNGKAKLTWVTVREIRRRAADGVTAAQLAIEYGEKYGIAPRTLRNVLERRTWKEAA